MHEELPRVRNLRRDDGSATAGADWADGVGSGCPRVRAEPAADRWQFLPRTIERLRSGKRLRIVMLGDSICNDTSNSLYETRLARFYPQASVEVVTRSTRISWTPPLSRLELWPSRKTTTAESPSSIVT